MILINSLLFYHLIISMNSIPKEVSSTVNSLKSKLAGKILIGTAGLFATLGVISYFQSFSAQREIDYRKSQLKLPIVKLTQEQLINPPWNHQNLRSWLFRRVEFQGRPIHRKATLVPHHRFDKYGFEYVLPVVIKQNQQFQDQSGVIMNLGWLPVELKSPTSRYRVETPVWTKYLGFVSTLDSLKNTSWLEGNAYQKGRLGYTCSDMNDFARSSEFVNQKAASVAMIERLHETGIVDQRSAQRNSCTCQFSEEYPYAKTESGALQLAKMPWDYRNEAKYYFAATLASLLVGASII